MEEELITKKELLDTYGISYGALYRWKRKKLIPDSWFIHKSTFTGQETFMPKKKILERVEMIMKLKDTMSLDAIAESFIPSFSKMELDNNEILQYEISDQATLDSYLKISKQMLPLSYQRLIELFCFKKLNSGHYDAIKCITDNLDSINSNTILFIITINGYDFSFIDNSGGENIRFNNSNDITVNRYHITDWIAEIENIIKREI